MAFPFAMFTRRLWSFVGRGRISRATGVGSAIWFSNVSSPKEEQPYEQDDDPKDNVHFLRAKEVIRRARAGRPQKRVLVWIKYVV